MPTRTFRVSHTARGPILGDSRDRLPLSFTFVDVELDADLNSVATRADGMTSVAVSDGKAIAALFADRSIQSIDEIDRRRFAAEASE